MRANPMKDVLSPADVDDGVFENEGVNADSLEAGHVDKAFVAEIIERGHGAS